MQIGIYSPRDTLLAQQRGAIRTFNQTACLDLTVHTFSDQQQLEQAATAIPFDILSYDVDGEDTESAVRERLERVAHTLPNCRIFILSESERQAVFGYSIRAAGYLLLPFDEEEFFSLFASLLREKIKVKEQFLPVKVNGVWSQVNANHVTHLESRGHNLIFHLNNGRQIKAAAGFRDYQSLLDINPYYLRCHKSYMVNLQYVKSWEMSRFHLADGTEVNISRPYWQTARRVYACYATQTVDELQQQNSTEQAAPERAEPSKKIQEVPRR